MDNLKTLTFDSLIRRMWARRWVCAVLGIAIVGGGAAFALLSEKIYRAEALVAPNRDAGSQSGMESMLGSLGSIASVAGILGSEETLKDEAIATLRSRAFLQGFIESEGILPQLYADKWDVTKRSWKPGLERKPTAARAWSMFRDKALRIEPVRGTALYKISVEWSDTKLPSVWLGALIQKLNEEMRGRQMREASAVLEFLKNQVERTDTIEVRAALFRLAETQLRRSAMASVREDYAFRIIDPPFPSEQDQFVRPQRVLIMALSLLLAGAVITLVAAFSPRRAAD
jgi:uncharacterized protein involved in exopolysaccharide biosynthesis